MSLTLTQAWAGGVISINVGGFDTVHNVTGTLGAVPAANWNNLTTVNNPSGSSLQDDSGIATTLAMSSSGWVRDTFNAWGDDRANMFSNFIGRQGDTLNDATITLTGIPYASYDVYIYYTGFISKQVQAWVDSQGGTTNYGLRGPSSGGGLSGYVQYQTTDQATAWADADGGTAGGNYLVITGLTAVTLTLTSSGLPDQAGWEMDGIAGLQIVRVGAVPTYTITASAGAGGTVTPAGTNTVDEGFNVPYVITPNLGYAVSNVVVDSFSVGAVTSYTFTNVTANHTIAATFTALPSQLVSGKVTDGSAGIPGATVYFRLSAPAYVNPLYTTTTTNGAGDYSISLPPANWHVSAIKDGYDYAADSTFAVTSTPVALPDIVLTANPNWDVLFSLNTDELSGIADGDRITNWNGMASMTTYNNELPLLGPVVETIGTNKWEKNTRAPYNDTASPTIHERGDGFLQGTYATPIPVNGASIVAVVRPVRNSESPGWTSIVDILYDRLVLGIKSDTGELVIWRNGNLLLSGVIVPDGQKTVLSLVVKQTGEYKVWANGNEVINITSTSEMTALVPGIEDFKKFINVGRNNPDRWTTFNGNIGDVYCYKRAIPDAKRTALEQALAAKFGVVVPVFTTISGKVTLPDGVTGVVGATVTATGTPGTFTNATALDGTYSLTVEGPASYTVGAAKASFSTPASQNVSVSTNPVTGINFILSPINAIQGVVKTVSGTPIYNAVVQVGGPGKPAAVTDVNGRYLVTGIDAIDPLEVYADAVGFADNTQSIDGTPSATGTITLDITLTNKVEAGVIANGGLELWSGGLPVDWRFFNGTGVTASPSANKFSGSFSAFVTASQQYAFLMASVDVVPGSYYNCYFKLKGDPGVPQCFPMPAFRDDNGDEVLALVSAEPGHAGYAHAPATNWLQYLHFVYQSVGMPFVRIPAPDGATKMTVIFGFDTLPSAGKGIYVDDVVIDRVGPDAQPVPPTPLVPPGGVKIVGGAPTFTFPTVWGYKYRLQYKNALSDSTWQIVPPGFVTSTGADMTVTDSTAAGQPHRFYRIEALP